jgi:hypothetical protein
VRRAKMVKSLPSTTTPSASEFSPKIVPDLNSTFFFSRLLHI